jgi:hypothetical protein
MIWMVLVCSLWWVAPEVTKELPQQMILNFSTQKGMGAKNLGQTLPFYHT